jgi:hypothetical protein
MLWVMAVRGSFGIRLGAMLVPAANSRPARVAKKRTPLGKTAMARSGR